MSQFGMQLPKQGKIQQQTGPISRNAQINMSARGIDICFGSGGSVYDSPIGRKTQSFQWNKHQQPRQELYSKIQAGTGTTITDQHIKTGNNFDVTLRNNQHPFHSNGIRQLEFNNQRLDKLKENSRFRSPDKNDINTTDEKMFYDIKGNTYKNTLIPEETANNQFNVKQFSQTMQDWKAPRSNTRVKVNPKYKGYIRSGAILFNNINQQNVQDQPTPKATSTNRNQVMRAHSQSVDIDAEEKIKRTNNYENWVNISTKKSTQKLAPYMSSRYTQNKSPQKHLDHIRKTMGQANAYSPDFQLQKMNNYDNTFKNIPRNVLDKFEVSKYYHDNKSGKTLSNDGSKKQLLGSSMGPGGRAVLYAAVPKQESSPQKLQSSMGKTKTSPLNYKKDQETGDYLETHIKNYKDWHHYDSNMNNLIVHQKKIVNSKNYELDQRAVGMHAYGYQPIYDKHIDNKRKVDGIMLSQTTGKSPEDRLPNNRKKFTPITTYMKSLHDTRITNMYGCKSNFLRPNLNYS